MRPTIPPLALVLFASLVWTGCGEDLDKKSEAPTIPVQGELLNSAPKPETKVDPRPGSLTEAVPEPEDGSSVSSGTAETSILSATGSPEPSPEVVSSATVETKATGSGLVAAAEAADLPASASAVSGSNSAPGDGSTVDEDGVHKFVSFDALSGYEYFLTPINESSLNAEAPKKDQIPPHIRALNGQKVAIEGYMVPIDVEGERIKSFIHTNSVMMCCFGVMPWINEWIFVEMVNEDGSDFYDNVLLKVKGTLEVGEEIEDGMVVSLYRMKATEVISTGEPMPFLFDY